MSTEHLLWLSAILLWIAGAAHSYLGERYLLRRLLAMANLPLLYKDPGYTRRLIRLAWHVTSAAWWGFAALLIVMTARPANEIRTLAMALAVTFLITGVMILAAGRLRHPGWPLFLIAATTTAWAVW